MKILIIFCFTHLPLFAYSQLTGAEKKMLHINDSLNKEISILEEKLKRVKNTSGIYKKIDKESTAARSLQSEMTQDLTQIYNTTTNINNYIQNLNELYINESRKPESKETERVKKEIVALSDQFVKKVEPLKISTEEIENDLKQNNLGSVVEEAADNSRLSERSREDEILKEEMQSKINAIQDQAAKTNSELKEEISVLKSDLAQLKETFNDKLDEVNKGIKDLKKDIADPSSSINHSRTEIIIIPQVGISASIDSCWCFQSHTHLLVGLTHKRLPQFLIGADIGWDSYNTFNTSPSFLLSLRGALSDDGLAQREVGSSPKYYVSIIGEIGFSKIIEKEIDILNYEKRWDFTYNLGGSITASYSRYISPFLMISYRNQKVNELSDTNEFQTKGYKSLNFIVGISFYLIN